MLPRSELEPASASNSASALISNSKAKLREQVSPSGELRGSSSLEVEHVLSALTESLEPDSTNFLGETMLSPKERWDEITALVATGVLRQLNAKKAES